MSGVPCSPFLLVHISWAALWEGCRTTPVPGLSPQASHHLQNKAHPPPHGPRGSMAGLWAASPLCSPLSLPTSPFPPALPTSVLFLSTLSTLPSLGLCTCGSLCLECAPPRQSPGSLLHCIPGPTQISPPQGGFLTTPPPSHPSQCCFMCLPSTLRLLTGCSVVTLSLVLFPFPLSHPLALSEGRTLASAFPVLGTWQVLLHILPRHPASW